MEKIKCSPEFLNEEGMYEREYVENECTPACKYYEMCLEELDLDPDWDFPEWDEREATDREIDKGIAFYDWVKNKYLMYFKKNE